MYIIGVLLHPKVSRPLNLNKEFLHKSSGQISTRSIHGTGIFTYIWLIFMVNAGNYVTMPYMDAMG